MSSTLSAGSPDTPRGRLAAALLPRAEELIDEFSADLPADAVVRCLEAALSGAMLVRLEGDDAVTATLAAAREDCLALVAAKAEAALAS